MNELTVQADDLLRGLQAVAPHASKPSSSFVLDVVRFEVVNDRLLLLATDRHVLAMWRFPTRTNYPTVPAEFAASVSMNEVKRLIPFLRDGKSLPAVLTLADGALTVNVCGSVLRTSNVEAAFPAVHHLIEAAVASANDPFEAMQRAYDPAQLAKFVKAAGRDDAVVLHPALPNKPGLVTVGENFVALVMPIRHAAPVTVENWFAPPALTERAVA